eukprot:6305553-Amphidinium_carterae.1
MKSIARLSVLHRKIVDKNCSKVSDRLLEWISLQLLLGCEKRSTGTVGLVLTVCWPVGLAVPKCTGVVSLSLCAVQEGFLGGLCAPEE